jgi:hypothetical protein
MEAAFSGQQSEAALGNQHSAVSGKRNQNQKPLTTEDAESTHPNEPKPGSLGAPDTEEGKTLSLIHDKPGQVNTDEEERVKQRVEELVGKLGETYDELIRLMDQNPAVARQVTGTPANHEMANHEKVEKLKQRLDMADATPRCRWIKQGGTTCGSPQMKNHIYCFAHTQMAEAQALALRLPPPEDANAIQVGLMRIQKALIEDTITTRKAGLLLYSMQLALTNVGQTTFGQAKDEELVLETVDEEEALSSQRAAFSERQNQQQNQRPFTAEGAKGNGERQNQNQRPLTTKDTKDTEEEQGLLRMRSDRRGVQRGIKQIEWKPSADMYRMDTREGREAYEASLRTKIAPRPCAEERQLEPRIATDDRAETYYSSLGDERLNSLRSPMPKDMGLGPRSASEPLDADTGAGSIVRTETHAVLG